MLHLLILIALFGSWELQAISSQPDEQALGHGYSRRGDHIFFAGERIDRAGAHDIDRFAEAVGYPLTLAKDVDAASFKALSEEYTKDKNKVYYKWISPGRFWVVELPNADPATFEVLDFSLARDAKHVWRSDVPIPGADAPTAEAVRPHWVWKDRNRVYYQHQVIPGADPETFRHLEQGFYRDRGRVYWCTSPLVGADPDAFKTTGEESPYGHDGKHVWSGETLLDEIDAPTFTMLHEHVFKDLNGVYVGTEASPVLGADPASFEKVGQVKSRYALFRDQSRFYLHDPSYNEIWTLQRQGDSLLISKPVWHGGSETRARVHGATVSTTLVGHEISPPELSMQPDFRDVEPPEWEKDKLTRLSEAFVDAHEQIRQLLKDK